jgi:hypothetical protein
VDAATGEYIFDAFGDRWSRLTFLVYLNDDFEGGCTTYYTPSECSLTDASFLMVTGCVCVGGGGGGEEVPSLAALKGAVHTYRRHTR